MAPKKQQQLKNAIPKELQDSIAGTVSATSERRKTQFSRELRLMAYGFGDVANPRSDTVDLLEELCAKAADVSKQRGRVKMEDFLFVLRKDQKKLARAEELLFRYDELLKARKAFDAAEDYQ